MGFFDKLVKHAKAPITKMKKDYKDPVGATKQLLNDPLGRVQEEFTGKTGDVLPIIPQDPLKEPSVEGYEDVLGDKDPLALPDDETLRLKARRKIGQTQRERNMLSKRKSAFIPKPNKGAAKKARVAEKRTIPTKASEAAKTKKRDGLKNLSGYFNRRFL